MQKKKSLFENFKFRIFIKYFFLLVGFLLIPFTVLEVLFTNYVMNEYKNEIYAMAQNSVDYICGTVEKELEDIYEIKALAMQNEQIRNFAGTAFGAKRGDRVYEAYEISKIMEEYCHYRDIVTEIHLYSELRDMVVIPFGIYTAEEYYTEFLKDSGMDYLQWIRMINGEERSMLPLVYQADSPNPGKNVAIVSSLSHSEKKHSAMFTILDMNRILDIYRNITREMPKMYFAVLSGEQIAALSEELPETLDEQAIVRCKNGDSPEKGYVVFQSVSADSGLSYVCIADEKIILEKFVKTKTFFRVFIVLLLFGMLALAFLFSNKTFGPVKEMLLLYSSENMYKMGGLNELQELFIHVFDSNKRLRDVVVKQEKCINNNMFRLLLQNSMELDEYALKVLFEAMPVSQEAKYYRVIILEPEQSKNGSEESFSLFLLSTLHRMCDNAGVKYCVIPNENNKNIFLFSYEEQRSKIKTILEEALQELRQSEKREVYAALGREVNCLNDFSKSYEAALHALQKCRNGIPCCETGEESLADDFPLLDKERLTSCLLAGNREGLEQFFGKLSFELFGDYAQTYRMQNYVRYFLYDALKEALESKAEYNRRLADQMEKCTSALGLNKYEDSFRIIRQSFLDAAEELAGQNSGKKKNFEDVIQYIQENYGVYELSLKMIADEMHISYKYLSDVFKKETGKNFLEYVHDVRNRKAKELLVTTEISIAQIGGQVGFLSSNTFIKTFKKLNGVTPGEFRKNYRIEA